MHREVRLFYGVSFSSVGILAFLLVMLGLMTSCGNKTSDAKAGQSIARVNGDEITVHQLNNELQRANVQPGQQAEAGKQIARALVDRQILVQEALKARLDRNPRVMQAVESAKAQILAQAYLEEKVSSLAKPTEAEIADYRAKHVDIFANRKVYVMDELSFATEGNAQALQDLSNSAKTLEEVTKWLDEHQVRHARGQAVHAAETLPPELLAKISEMVVGEIIFINVNGRTVAGRMLEIKDAPISENDSKPLIERIVVAQKRKQVAESELERLRAAAKIEYINKSFEPGLATKATKPADSNRTDSHIVKGLSGL